MANALRVQIDQLTFEGRDRPTLKDIRFESETGSVTLIAGGAASGKSSLLHCITGAATRFFNAQFIGRVEILGEDIAQLTLPMMCEKAAYMMQEPQNQLLCPTVGADAAFGAENLNLPRNEVKNRVSEALAFAGLSGFEARSTDSLSGGQAQRAVLAGVLAMRSPVLLLDQPAAQLDPAGRKELFRRLFALRERGITLVMVIDRYDPIFEHADRVLVMEDGRIRAELTPMEYAARCERELARLPEWRGSGKKEIAEPAVELKNAGFTYKNSPFGCRAIDLTVKKGEFVAVAGLNGSGKTTLAKMIAGLYAAQSGEVRIFGEAYAKRGRDALRKRIGFVYQNPDYQLFADTLTAEVGFALKLRGVPDKEAEKIVEEKLKEAGLWELRESHPHRLSLGQRRLLAMAGALACEPEIILADEPTAGLNEAQSCEAASRFARLGESGKTVIMITHDISIARRFAQRIVVMSQGGIALDVPSERLDEYAETLKELGLDFENTHQTEDRK